ncbi:adenylate kinase [archaeon MnTg01]|nr:adenylate kinase [archaeon MnTg01]
MEGVSKKVIIVGIPGVGKSTLVTKIVEILNSRQKSVSVNSFGSIMFEEAQKNGIKNRDDLRKLSMEEQHILQKKAAEKIAKLEDDLVIIDTHTFIITNAGFYPGLPHNVLEIIKPSNFISVYARPEEIYNRRMKDTSRQRDVVSIDNIKKEMAISDAMLSSCAVFSGSPMKPVFNTEGKVEEAANTVISAIEI